MTEGKGIRFDQSNHLQTITQIHQGVWMKVMPFCLANVLNLCLVAFAKKFIFHKKEDVGISFNDFHLSSLSLVIAFLSVVRLSLAFADYKGQRASVQSMTRACRNVVFHSVAFTRDDNGLKAKQWRLDIARESMALLRLLVTALHFKTAGKDKKMSMALSKEENAIIEANIGDDTERSAYAITMFLQTTISSHQKHILIKHGEHYALKLYSFVEDYTKAYNECYEMLDSGLPFPVIQMSRTLVFLYVYSLPWVIYDGEHSDFGFYPAMLYILFVTYAFIGLEYVSIEMTDPFGDGENALNILDVVEKVFKDIIMCIEGCDGEENAGILKNYATLMNDIEIEYDESTRSSKIVLNSSIRNESLRSGGYNSIV